MEKNKDKKKKRRRLLLLILLLAFVIIVLLFHFRLYLKNEEQAGISKSTNQVKITSDEKDRNLKSSDEVVLQGFGTLSITKDYPCIYLKNLDVNAIYLQYDVYLEDELMYQTELISPGMMEKYDLYEILGGQGEYELEYFISLYEMDTLKKCPSVYKMKQNIQLS